jgi:glycosyltransferase involved in cell wall biosynthesis
MQNLNKRLPPPFARLEQSVYRQACGATALTSEVADVLRARGFRKPIVTVPLAVELSAFRPTAVPELRAEHGLVTPVLGYVGRLSEGKGIDLFLEALRRLRDERRTFTGLIVGSGPAEAAVREQIAAFDLASRVRLLPGVPHEQVARYYNCLDVAVVPSRTMRGWKEQFGRVLIEAMACGVPVVGSDSGAIPEVIASAGGGLIFPEGDSRRLTDCLRLLLADPPLRRRLADAGAAAVGRLYSYEAVADRLRGALLAFAGQGSPAEVAVSP